jgi:hypothetical protein
MMLKETGNKTEFYRMYHSFRSCHVKTISGRVKMQNGRAKIQNSRMEVLISCVICKSVV